MKKLWNILLDWIVGFRNPFYFGVDYTDVAWKWHGGYGKWSDVFVVRVEKE